MYFLASFDDGRVHLFVDQDGGEMRYLTNTTGGDRVEVREGDTARSMASGFTYAKVRRLGDDVGEDEEIKALYDALVDLEEVSSRGLS